MTETRSLSALPDRVVQRVAKLVLVAPDELRRIIADELSACLPRVLTAPEHEVGPACMFVDVPPTIVMDINFREPYTQGYRHALSDLRKQLAGLTPPPQEKHEKETTGGQAHLKGARKADQETGTSDAGSLGASGVCLQQHEANRQHVLAAPPPTPARQGRNHWIASLAPCFNNDEVVSVDFRSFSGKIVATVTRNEWLEAREQLAGLTPHPEPEQGYEATVRSIAAMLGWMNVPPRDVLERDINALKARAALTSPRSPLNEVP